MFAGCVFRFGDGRSAAAVLAGLFAALPFEANALVTCEAANFAAFEACFDDYHDDMSGDDHLIHVSADFNIDALIDIGSVNFSPGAVTLTSSGAARTLTRNVQDHLFVVEANSSFILENIIIDGNKSVFSSSNGTESPLVIVNGEAMFEMRDGAVLRNNYSQSGGGVHNKSVFVMNGGEIDGCGDELATGGGVYSYGAYASFVMNGGEIKNNLASGGGGVSSNDFTMNGGKIYGNTATDAGGGVIGNLAMNGGEISGNVANGIEGGGGGGVWASDDISLGGTAKIRGNKTIVSGVESVSNFVLPFWGSVELRSPAAGMEIGVQVVEVVGDCAWDPCYINPIEGVVASNAMEEYEDYFFSDIDEMDAQFLDGEILFTKVAKVSRAKVEMAVPRTGGAAYTHREAIVAAGAGFAVASLEWNPPAAVAFEPDKEYAAAMRLKTSFGFVFADGADVAINGESVGASVVSRSRRSIDIRHLFGRTNAEYAVVSLDRPELFAKDETLSTSSKIYMVAGGDAFCGELAGTQVHITVGAQDMELSVGGKLLDGSIAADGSVNYDVGFEYGKSGGADTLFYSTRIKGSPIISNDSLIIITPIDFEKAIKQKWNALMVNNNPKSNGGFKFSEFKWFKNGELLENNLQYYAGGADKGFFKESDSYFVEFATSEGLKVNSCPGHAKEGIVSTAAQGQPAFKKRVLGVDGMSAAEGAKVFSGSGKRSAGEAAGVYFVEEH